MAWVSVKNSIAPSSQALERCALLPGALLREAQHCVGPLVLLVLWWPHSNAEIEHANTGEYRYG